MDMQLSPAPIGFAALVASRWHSRLGVVAEALELFNQTLSRAVTASDADKPAAMARVSLIMGCSWPASAAMKAMSMLGLPEPQARESISLGLRLAEPILVRMAQNPRTPPRVVEEVLALWMHENTPALRLDERMGAVLGLDMREFPPAAGVGAGEASTVFSQQPALERTVFNAAMRTSVRSAPPEARLAFSMAMMATLQQVRAGLSSIDIGDMLALDACKSAVSRADDAREAMAAAAAAAGGAAANEVLHAEARLAARTAKQAFLVAKLRVRAVRAAKGGGATGGAPKGPASAASRDDKSEASEEMSGNTSEEAELDDMENESEASEEMSGDASEEAELNDMEHDIEALDGLVGGHDDGPEEADEIPGDSDEEAGLDYMEEDFEMPDDPMRAKLVDGRTTCDCRAVTLLPLGLQLEELVKGCLMKWVCSAS